jgi:hypothetical protein
LRSPPPAATISSSCCQWTVTTPRELAIRFQSQCRSVVLRDRELRPLPKLFLHAVEIIQVGELKSVCLCPGEAHRKKREAVSGHVDGPLFAVPSIGVGGRPKIRLTKIRQAFADGVDAFENVLVLFLEVSRHVTAGGDHAVSLDGDDGGEVGLRPTTDAVAIDRGAAVIAEVHQGPRNQG